MSLPGIDPNKPNRANVCFDIHEVPLHKAAISGSLEAVRVLVSHACVDVNYQDVCSSFI